MDLKGKLRYVRTQVRNLTLADLAKKTGLSIGYLSDAENGRSNMSIKSLEKVAEALDVSMAYLIDDTNMSLKKLIELNHDANLPDDLVEFFSSQESLPYAKLAKDLHNEKVDPEFLRDLLAAIKNMKSK